MALIVGAMVMSTFADGMWLFADVAWLFGGPLAFVLGVVGLIMSQRKGVGIAAAILGVLDFVSVPVIMAIGIMMVGHF